MKINLRFTIYDLRLLPKRFCIRLSSIVNRHLLPFFLLCLFASGVLILTAQEMAEQPRVESRFTFARIRFTSTMMQIFGREMGDWAGPPWGHDWPRSEEHLMKILAEVTRLDVNPGGHIISFQSDECFKYPIAYLCEVGFLQLSEEEARRMAEYLLRGGFLIVDDFRGPRELNNFKQQLKQVFPDRLLEEIPRTHPIWKSFYDISDLSIVPPYSQFLIPQYLGMSDDNGRLMMVVDYNNDISDYWEWSDDPIMPIESTNEAYKYGVNYIMYALTH